MDNAPAHRQRSPWFYVLIGCGGLAGLICLAGSIFVFFVGKQVKSLSDGVSDPAERQKNAVEQLGGLPEGYHVLASVSVFGVMRTTVLSDQPPSPDGGLAVGGRVFTYMRVMANEQNAQTRAFFDGTASEGAGVGGGLRLDPKSVFKRGELKIDGRGLRYALMRSDGDGPQPTSLGNAVLFECPDDALRVGVWSQADPTPDAETGALDLAGTVADEAQLAKFLKPINPCGR
jgi:hypothetical protein